jgi:hypothetical protein
VFWTLVGLLFVIAFLAEISYSLAVAVVIFLFFAWVASRVLRLSREVARGGRR